MAFITLNESKVEYLSLEERLIVIHLRCGALLVREWVYVGCLRLCELLILLRVGSGTALVVNQGSVSLRLLIFGVLQHLLNLFLFFVLVRV